MFSSVFFYLFKCFQLRICEGQIQKQGWGSLPGDIHVANFPVSSEAAVTKRRNLWEEGNWSQMASGCFCPSPLFFANQFVVSIPTELSGSFNKTKVICVGEGNRVRLVEGASGKELPWERDRPQSPDILGLVREWIYPGPSQAPVRTLRAR